MIENLYASFVNLDWRTDRLAHMTEQLKKISLPVTRTRGLPWKEVVNNMPINDLHKIAVMQNRTPGAIGCHFSQVSVMKEALAQGKHAAVFEDDIIFCSDFDKRLKYIDNWTKTHDWDVIWLGGTFHVPAFWHKIGTSGMPPNCSLQLGHDCQSTDDPRMVKTFGAFSTYAYIVNYNSIEKITGMLEDFLPKTIGIDYSFISFGNKINAFAFVPGCTKQIDNISDIGTGMTVFSGFAKLNGTIENSRYWYQELMTDFDPSTFNFDL